MKLSKVRMLGISMLLLSTMAISVFAYEYVTSQQIPTGIVVMAPTVQIGVYWDEACTQAVTIIDFGEIIQPNSEQWLNQTLYIKNEGTVTLTVYWNSSLSLKTSEITDKWNKYPFSPYLHPLNNTIMSSGSVKKTYYWVIISPYVSIATYNWTLTVWGEY